MDHKNKNRIEVKCESAPVPFYELVESRIVKMKINPVKNSNSSHTTGISMITERNGNFYEVKIEGDVTECSERNVVTNGNENSVAPSSLVEKIRNKMQSLRSNKNKYLNVNSEDRIEIIEKNGEIIIKKE